jgi:hypothetical protein
LGEGPPVEREKEREKREATVGGLNTLKSALDRTLSGLAGLCPVRTLSRERCRLERIEDLTDCIVTKQVYICI